jgi:hypothetical protein
LLLDMATGIPKGIFDSARHPTTPQYHSPYPHSSRPGMVPSIAAAPTGEPTGLQLPERSVPRRQK